MAVAQSDWIARRLKTLGPSVEIERVVIQTSGDKFLPGAPPSSAPSADSAPDNIKAMFVKEIEEALLEGTIDFAVHSSKDLPAVLPEGLRIAAYPEREDPRDAYVAGASTWERLGPGAAVGSSSLRRRIQMKLLKPGVSCLDIRGNVDTRLKRLSEGSVQGLLLAEAGLKRLDKSSVRRRLVPLDEMVPAPGQGALALEAREDGRAVLDILKSLDDAPTRLAVECERAFMAEMGGGCRSPLGACAALEGGRLRLRAFWSDAEGVRPVRRSAECAAEPGEAISLARRLAGEILRFAA